MATLIRYPLGSITSLVRWGKAPHTVQFTCSFESLSNLSLGSWAMTPMTPEIVANSCVGTSACSLSGIFITKLPGCMRFTKSPRW